MKHVVVIGGGFAGLMVLRQLVKSKNLKLTLINKNNFFLFTPRLTELLNGSISKKIVIKDIKKIFGNKINFINDTAEYINFNKKYVKIEKNNVKINYDYLIISQGATTNYFGNKNIEKNTIGYKDYNAVLKIKNKIENNVQKYSKSNKKEFLAFAVIGGGLTGIELICSLRETVIKEIKKYTDINSKDVRFILMQAENTIAPQLQENARLKIERYFKNNNIEVMTETMAEDIKNDTIITRDKKIKASTIVWTAGVKANTTKTNPKIKLDKGNTIKVTSKLKIPGYDDIYIAGDDALFIENNKPLAATAQTAWQQGVNIGKNILRRINGKREKDFHYFHKGTLIVLGSKHGIFTYKNLNFDGKLAWYFRHLAYKYRFWQIT